MLWLHPFILSGVISPLISSSILVGGGGAAERRYPVSEVRGSGQEEIPHPPKPEARGDGWEELPHVPKPEAKGGGREEQLMIEARGSGQEDQSQVQGAVVAPAQEGLEELSHNEGQKGWR